MGSVQDIDDSSSDDDDSDDDVPKHRKVNSKIQSFFNNNFSKNRERYKFMEFNLGYRPERKKKAHPSFKVH